MPRLGLPEIIPLAKSLRKRQTPAEAVLWERLRKSKLNGYKFRRQHPLGRFVLDFYCEEKKVAVEVDGPIHKNPEIRRKDACRQRLIEESGLRVLRFSNDEVMRNVEEVLAKIEEELER